MATMYPNVVNCSTMRLFVKSYDTFEPIPGKPITTFELLIPLPENQGYVFTLVQLDRACEGTEQFFATLSQELERLVATFNHQANVQHRFEQFLAGLNSSLAQHVRVGHWNIPIEQIHALVGILSYETILFSGVGELFALFLRRDAQTQRYQVFNLFRGIQAEQALVTWEKLFAVVLDGHIDTGDVLALSNQNIQQAIDTHSLNTILSTLPPKSAAENIRPYFGPKDPLALIILKAEQDPQIHTVTPSQHSVDQMVQTTEETELLLGDQTRQVQYVVQNVQKSVKKHFQGRSGLLFRPLWNIFLSVVTVLGKMAFALGGWFIKIIPLLSKPSYRSHLASQWSIWRRASFPKLHRLPKSTRLLILIACVLVGIILISIWGVSRASERSDALKVYNEKVSEVESRIEQAAGSIIYKDEPQALLFYEQAEALAKALPSEDPGQQEQQRSLLERIEQGLKELRHIITINDPAIFADLSSLGSGKVLVATKNGLVAISRSGTMNQFHREDGAPLLEAQSLGINEEIIAASVEEDRLWLLTSSGAIYTWVSGDTLATKTELQAPANTVWSDLESYGDRLYVLSPAGGGNEAQIIRFDGNKPQTETRWIRSQSSDLKNAVGLAIDGTIFVLTKEGNLVRFVSGSEIGWEPGSINPNIEQATRLWTDAQSRFVYILEPSRSRIVVFQKENGAFITQYQSAAFVGSQDLFIDEAKRQMYVLTQTTIYQIQASHLIGT